MAPLQLKLQQSCSSAAMLTLITSGDPCDAAFFHPLRFLDFPL